MRWRYPGEQGWRIIVITNLRCSIVGGAEAHDRLVAQAKKYFLNRGMELLPRHTYADAVRWTGRFLFLVSRNEGIPLTVIHASGSDEEGRTHFANEFLSTATFDALPYNAGWSAQDEGGTIKLITIRP